MTIEVKQMLIKSTVVQGQQTSGLGRENKRNLEEIRQNILLECKQLIMEIMREEQER